MHVENTVGKGELAYYQQIPPLPTEFSKVLYCKQAKTQVFFEKGSS